MPTLERDSIASLIPRLPDELNLLPLNEIVPELIIHPCEGDGLEPHPRKEHWSGCRVAERVKVPSVLWHYAERLLEKCVSSDDVVNELLICRAGLVTASPASVDELKPPLMKQLEEDLSRFFILQVPPLFEEPDLRMSKLGLGVCPQMLDNIC